MSRIDQVAQAIKKELGSIIHDELNDPRLGFITIIKYNKIQDALHNYFIIIDL